MIEKIYTSPAPGAHQAVLDQIEVVAGMGIKGDRNFAKSFYPGQNLTLVEAEVIEAFCLSQHREIDHSISRRNLITRGVSLNPLVGKKFKIGSVVLLGIELCEPCSTLGESLASPDLTPAKVVKYWLGRGGLRVDVIEGGIIRVGMPVHLI